MITFNDDVQAFHCSHCRRLTPIERYVLRDPYKFVEVKDKVALSHKACEQYSSPRMANAARRFRQGVQQALRERQFQEA